MVGNERLMVKLRASVSADIPLHLPWSCSLPLSSFKDSRKEAVSVQAEAFFPQSQANASLGPVLL